jgi:hypothetical protein
LIALDSSKLIADKTRAAFKVGDQYSDLDALKTAVDKFALEHHFTLRKSKSLGVVCLRAKHWHIVLEKKKEDHTSLKKVLSMECTCPWAIWFLRSQKRA